MKVIIVGFGVVGRALAKLLQNRTGDLRRNYGMNLRVVAISDSTSVARAASGVRLGEALSLKEKKNMVGERRAEDTVALIKKSDADVLIELTPTNPKTGEPAL
jgi:homoserine dehydrogenase